MLKSILITLALFLALAIASLLWRLPVSTLSDEVTKQSQFSTLIGQYLSMSNDGDVDGLSGVLTEVPVDYYSKYNECTHRIGEQEVPIKDLGYPQLIPFGGKLVNQGKIDYELASIRDLSSTLRSKNYLNFRISRVKQNGSHAAVHAEISRPGDYYGRGQWFLFNLENGTWKIFMISNQRFLEEDNKYFALSECNESPW